MKRLIFFFIVLGVATKLFSQQTVLLPAPHKTGGMPLMDALSKRSTSRSFDTKDLPIEKLSDLLWAADGINRANGKRTAPSSMDKQEITIYVLIKNGAYTYDVVKNQLDQVVADDIRSFGGKQEFVKDAPITLVYVADYSKMSDGKPEDKKVTSSCNAGFISQNVYLFCASENLATGVRAYIDYDVLTSKLKLPENKKIVMAQSVGYFK